MNDTALQTAKELLSHSKKIVVIGHKNPDGDAIGSCLALSFFLKKLGHDTQVLMPNDFPEFLKWLPGCENILLFEKSRITKFFLF